MVLESENRARQSERHPVKSLFGFAAWLFFGALALLFGWKDTDHDKGL